MLRMEDGRLPSSAKIAGALLAAAENHNILQKQYTETWRAVQIETVNESVRRTLVTSAAYGSGIVDGKNAETRKSQIERHLLDDEALQRTQQNLDEQRWALRGVELSLESARVYRSVLHDIVRLRVAETLRETNDGLGLVYGWGQG